jgi:DNA end-binding protein Ku
MARPYWSGQIQISLVQFGVSLFTATESKSQMSFHQISRSTGERIRHQKVLQSTVESDESAPAVVKDDIVKGYEYSKGQYVIIEPSAVHRPQGTESGIRGKALLRRPRERGPD